MSDTVAADGRAACGLGAGAASGAVLAIDAGQTGIKIRRTHGESFSEWAAPGIRTDLPLLPQLAEVIAHAADRGLPATSIGIGVSGLTNEEVDAGYLLHAAMRLGTRRVLLAHDSITAYLGALGDARGAVVAAGTGVVTLAVGASEVARIDGWGNLIGDAGSGYWLGRATLDAVMRAHDGRGAATALTEVVRADFPDIEAAYIELQGDPSRVARIAAYARPLMQIAERDAVAAAIVAAGARELACSVIAGLRRVGEVPTSSQFSGTAGTPSVRAIGGLFTADRLSEAFSAELGRMLPQVELRIGEAHPLDGASALVEVPPTHPLAKHIAVAER